MKINLNYIRDTILLIAVKAALLMFTFNLTVGEHFENIMMGYGQAFLIVITYHVLAISDYKLNVIARLAAIEQEIKAGNDVFYAMNITKIANMLELKNKLIGSPPASDNSEQKEKGE